MEAVVAKKHDIRELVHTSLAEFEAFCEACFANGKKRIDLLEYIAFPDESPNEFLELIEDFSRLYREHAVPELTDKVIEESLAYHSVEGLTQYLDRLLDEPAYEFIPSIPRICAENDRTLLAYHLVRGALYMNRLLSILCKDGFGAIDSKLLFLSQRAMEHAITIRLCFEFTEQLEASESPARRLMQAKAGGIARAEKLYGQTKAYTQKRFDEMRAKGTKLSMSQIAQKIAYELEQRPIAGDEPLSNPYDTIYRWVRVLNKRASA